jgi:uncharacterized protein GlcG (DUF336 family)
VDRVVDPALVRRRGSLTEQGAAHVVDAARRAAADAGPPVCIAVVNESGQLLAFLRQDGCPSVAAALAIKKARTAAAVGTPTQAFWEFVGTDPALTSGLAHDPDLLALGGGAPVVVDGEVVGAVGVSGGHYTEDDTVSRAGAAAVSDQISAPAPWAETQRAGLTDRSGIESVPR